MVGATGGAYQSTINGLDRQTLSFAGALLSALSEASSDNLFNLTEQLFAPRKAAEQLSMAAEMGVGDAR